MVDPAAVRRLAGALPAVEDNSNDVRLAFAIAGKGFAWSFNERVHPRKPRIARLDILAVRCSFEAKEMLIAAAPDRFFDDDHYRGFPAVLVRLDVIDEGELADLLRGGWRALAPKALVKRLEG